MEAYEQFQIEKAETDAMVYDSMKNLCGIKCLCKVGEIKQRNTQKSYTGSNTDLCNNPIVLFRLVSYARLYIEYKCKKWLLQQLCLLLCDQYGYVPHFMNSTAMSLIM